jgi:hypothetical protein
MAPKPSIFVPQNPKACCWWTGILGKNKLSLHLQEVQIYTNFYTNLLTDIANSMRIRPLKDTLLKEKRQFGKILQHGHTEMKSGSICRALQIGG